MNHFLIVPLLICLVACGSGDGQSSGTKAVLNVSITGLPAGTDADVVITGMDGFNRVIVASQLLANVPPGVYSLTARNALSGSAVFAPRVSNQTVVVAATGVTPALVEYQSSGTLRLGLQQVAAGLDQPLFLAAPNGDSRLFVVERPGRVRIIQNGIVLPTPFLDISARVSTVGEGGLLSLAFDPQFASNGFFYVNFTDTTGLGDVVVERFHVPDGTPDVADPVPLRILTIEHQAGNHKGGRVAFDSDGFLYLSVGDGFADPGAGQLLDTLQAKVLRLDVRNASAAQPYAIPLSNPFVGQSNRRPEIWAYGLRNPWRFAFDAAAGLLYIADVGQSLREEVNVAPMTAAGVNYGWMLLEGSRCFLVDPCSPQGMTLPVLEYDHDGTVCAVMGGFVYRGTTIPELRGRYFYSDLCGGWLRSFRYSGGKATEQMDWNIDNVGQIYSFGEDGQGELYMLTIANIVYRIVRR